MPAAIPLVAAIAGSAVSSAVLGSVTFGSLIMGKIVSSGFGFLVSTAINQLGSRAFGSKPKTAEVNTGQTLDVMSSVDTHKIIYGKTRIGGTRLLATTTDTATGMAGAGSANKILHLLYVFTSHEIEEFSEIYFGDQLITLDVDGYVTTAPFGPRFARVKKHLGAADQAADPLMVSDVPGWTTNHRARGRAYLYVRFEYNATAFAQGVPQVSAVIKGKKVYDPRTALTAWSDDATLCTRDYVMNYCGVSTARFDDTYTNAAANICDEAVTLLDGTTQARYTSNGIVDTGVSRQSNLTALTASMAGAVVRIGRYIRIFAGAYDIPAVTLTDDMLAGDMTIRCATPRSELVNTVQGTFIDPTKDHQPTDFPVVTDASLVTEDNEISYSKDLQLQFTNHPEAAQRIAKLIMYKARQGINVTVPINHTALKCACWDTVMLTQSYLGFASKVFRITNWNMANAPLSAIVMTLQEESATSYDWAASEATEHDDPPDTTLPSPFEVGIPGNPSVTEALYETSGSAGVKTRATVSWGASDDAFVRDYKLEYKLIADTDYTVAGRTDELSFDIFDIAPGRYNFRVSAFNQLGVQSDFADSLPLEIYGLSAAPSNITNFSIAAMSSLAVLRWDTHPDLDVRQGGKIHIRHSTALTGAVWSESYSITDALDGLSNMAVVPLKSGTYLAKAIDSTGHYSDTAATVSTKNATIHTFSTLGTVTEDSGFSGTHSSTFVDGSVLTLQGAGLFDDITDFDSIPSLDYSGGAAATGIYTFATGFDNTTVKNFRLDTTMVVQIVNVVDLVDSRTDDIDDWQDFDGLNGTVSADAYIEVRETDDNPAGSPTWTAWKRVHAADYTCRALQLRAVLVSYDPAYTIQVSQLRATTRAL